MKNIEKSTRLGNVSYAIRGRVLAAANKLEAEGKEILKLNIGNPAPFDFEPPSPILEKIRESVAYAHGYCDSKGIAGAREAIMAYAAETKKIKNVDYDHIYIGNGASELIQMVMQGLLNPGDEVLVPAPDYPLWTASVNLYNGCAVHYLCDEANDWQPDVADIERKISSKSRAIVLINPNNPTGALYSQPLLEKIIDLARRHNLMIFADEIYDRIVYDGNKHVSPAALADDIPFITFNGLSKGSRVCGYRCGWMVLSGNLEVIKDFKSGLDTLASMRLCANVPVQHTIETAINGDDSIRELVDEGGRLRRQRDLVYRLCNSIDGLSCVKSAASLYSFPRIDSRKFNISNDEQFVLDFLNHSRVLLVHGSGFNWPNPDHFRVVFLPAVDVLEKALLRLGDFLSTYKQQ